MADIPLKPEDEMTNDLVGAVENIAQSVKAGSRDFTKSFTGLTTAIKRLQTTLVNAIKAIKIQVVAKPEKVQKPATKDKSTSTKEVVKEKETKTEVKSEKKTKTPKAELKKQDNATPIEVVVKPQSAELPKEKNQESVASDKQPPENKNVVDAEAMILKALSGNLNSFWKKLREFSSKTNDNDSVGKALSNLLEQGKVKRDADAPSLYRLVENVKESKSPEIKAPEIKALEIKAPEIKVPDVAEKKEPKQKIPKAPSQPKVVDPADEAEKQRKRVVREEADNANKRLRDLRLLAAEERKKERDARPEKEDQKKKEKEEKAVRSIGEQGSKKFVGPRLEEEGLANEKAKKDKQQADIAKDKTATDAKKAQEKKDAADAKSIANEKKTQDKKDAADAKAISDAKKVQDKKDAADAKAISDAKKVQDKKDAADAKAIADEAVKASKEKEKAEEESDKAERVLASYFRNKQKKEAEESEKAANDLVKQQEQAARNLEQANQKTQKELDGLIGAFQRLTPLFKGPLVNFGLKMIAKGIGYKQPKTMSKGGDVSYLADGGQAMKPKGTDTQPAMLTPGEFVVNKKASEDPENRKQLESINSGKNKKKTEYHSSGGSVGGVGYYAAGGAVAATAGVAMAAIGVAINSFTKSFAIASEAVSSFAGAVQKANPALMEQVGLAMDDLQAVVGRALSPAITMLVPLIRQFADYVDYSAKKFAPAIESIIKITKELMSPLLELGATVANALMPFTKLLVLQFGGIVKIIIPIIDLLSSLFETVTLLMGSLGDSEFLFGVFNNSIEILSRAVSIVAGTIQLIIGAFVVGVAKMIEVLGTLVNTISFGFAGESIEGFGEKVGKVGEKLYNKSLENFKAVGEGKPRRFKTGEMSGDKGLQKDSSYGASVRQVQSMSIVGIGDEMRKNALMAGIGQKSQEESLNQIEKNTGELVDLFKDLKMPQNTGAGRIVGPNPHAPAVVNENMGAVPGTVGTRWGAITPIN